MNGLLATSANPLGLSGAVLAVLLLAACNPGPAAGVAKLWTARDFVAAQGKPLDFGGFQPDELLVPEGGALRFGTGAQQGGPGLTIFPAVVETKVGAFVITDIWANHPQPWVQPVWGPVDENGARVTGVWNVFPVDVDSTFYSPFWRMELLFTPGLTPETYRSARDVLDAKVARRSGPIVLCPIVPEAVRFADDGSGPREPLTGAPLALPTKLSHAWVDGREVTYYDFGPDRAPADEQTLQEARAYFFVSAPGERPLPLAAVLPQDAKRHSLVRRVDVVIPAEARPFVPSNRPELRALLEARGLTVPDVPAALDGFQALALRVAGRPDCFQEATFPSNCDWLDSRARLELFPPGVVSEQPVQLAIAVVVP